MSRGPDLVLDLSLWYSRNSERGSLPARYRNWPLQNIYSDLGLVPWIIKRPWSVNYDGIDYAETRDSSSRTRIWKTPEGILTTRWEPGPDGDWWQTEYPVKDTADLALVDRVIKSMRYELVAELPEGDIDDVIELPMRPYSDLLHTFMGWSEGLMIALEEEELISALVNLMEEKHGCLVQDLLRFPQATFLAPDNLDANFISPGIFSNHMAAGYRKTTESLHGEDRTLTVHLGGNTRPLLSTLAACGVDCLEGICSPPQGDASLAEARSLVGAGTLLWGALAQDYLLPSCTEEDFHHACSAAMNEVQADGRAILGVADRVPPDAVFSRIEYLARLAQGGNRDSSGSPFQ
jgi:hypothetical protein